MKDILTYITIFTFLTAYSQQTKKYSDFVNQLEFIKTESVVEKYKNGNLKRKRTMTTYMVDSLEYIVFTGEYVEYKKNGRKKWEEVLDMFGAPLSSKTYLGGELFFTTKTLELDTNVKTFEEFVYNKKSTSIIYEYSEYYNDEDGKPILWKRGIKINKKKSGKWSTYENGKVVKTKMYKEIDKFRNMLPTRYLK